MVGCIADTRAELLDAFVGRLLRPMMERLLACGDVVRWNFERPAADRVDVHVYGADPAVLTARVVGLTAAAGLRSCAGHGRPPMDAAASLGTAVSQRCRSGRLLLARSPARAARSKRLLPSLVGSACRRSTAG
jgi:hypothetical protein